MEPRSRLTAEQREAVARRLQLKRASTPVSRSEDGEGVASFGQERLWFLEQLAPGEPTYVEHVALRLRGPLEVSALQRAVSQLFARHDALRTSFVHRDGQLWQRVQAGVTGQLERASVSALPAPEREGALQALLSQLARRPFELSVAPLARFTLVEVGEDEHVLVLVNHHLVSDGWSRTLLVRDLAACYHAARTGHEVDLPPLHASLRGHAEAERARFAAGEFDGELTFWRERLAGLPLLDLPSDRPRPQVRSARGGSQTFSIAPELVQALTSVARARGATLFAGLLAAFDAWLHQLSGCEDLAVATAVAGRGAPALEPVVGCFVNTVVLRTDLTGDPPFGELVSRARTALEQALARASVPFDRVVAALAPARDPSRSPLAQVMLTLLPEPRAAGALPGLAVEAQQVDVGVARLDLTVELTPAGGGLDGRVEFSTELFDPRTVAAWTQRLLVLIEAVASAPQRRLSELPRISLAEEAQLERWESPDRPVEPGSDVVVRFGAAASRTPDRLALAGDGRERTYREVHEQLCGLARALGARGIGPGSRVGVCMPHGPDLVVALWAVLASGAAYVPLDPAHPPRRLALVVEDAAPDVLLVADPARRLGDLEHLVFSSLQPVPAGALPEARPESLAYVLYTSGSTGRPKGVEVTRRNLASFFSAMDELLGAPERGAWLALTSYGFDISILELLWPLTRGMQVVAPTAAWVAAAEDRAAQAALPPVDLGLFFFAAEEGGEGYRLLLQAARFADRHGFSAVWTPERHFHSFGAPYPNPAVTGAAVAAITEQIAVRAGSVVLPLHPPVRVAEEWAVVDVLSNGRAGIAFASGWHADDFALAPDRYAERRRHLEEGMETVRRLWRGEAIVLPNGTGKPVEIRTRPRPVTPELPVWVTSSGDPATFERAGTLGAGLLTHLLGQDPGELAAKLGRYRAAWRAAGHPGQGHVVLMLHTFLGEDLEEVKAQVRGPFCAYLRTSLGLVRNLAHALGLDLDAPGFSADDLDALLGHAFDRYFGTSALLGTVESCAPLVQRLREIGVDELACLLDFGLPTDAVLASLPKLQELRSASATREPVDPVGELLGAHHITHFQCTPTAARELLSRCGPALGRLEVLLVGGEALPLDLGRALASTGAPVHNVYGPTEATVWASSAPVPPGIERMTIGRPLGHSRLAIRDAHGRRTAIGEAGELWIGGDAVARGYRGLPELTASRFQTDSAGARLYRTGDRARWTWEGTIEFLGRTDRQVKVRGFRIELGDIEAALLRHPAIREAVVDVRGEPEDLRIIAWIVGRLGMEPDPTQLREHLLAELPPYMVPSQFVPIEQVPTNPHGKADRSALPTPVAARVAGKRYVEPREPREHQVVEVWRAVLGVERVGVEDDFFELGGHSLLAIQLVGRLRTELGLALPLRSFMERPTVAGCVAWRAK
jgi:natural product biosynthesis luciferase-like monooxygenase protein